MCINSPGLWPNGVLDNQYVGCGMFFCYPPTPQQAPGTRNLEGQGCSEPCGLDFFRFLIDFFASNFYRIECAYLIGGLPQGLVCLGDTILSGTHNLNQFMFRNRIARLTTKNVILSG